MRAVMSDCGEAAMYLGRRQHDHVWCGVDADERGLTVDR